MIKLLLSPDQDSYTVTEGEDTIATKVGGGQPRMRRDLLNADSKVEVQFTVNPTEYQYIRAFYNYTNRGADQFLIDLIVETGELREYIARIIPGSWKLTSVKGHTFKVKFTLTVASNDDGLDYADIVTNFTPEPYVPPPAPVDWGNEEGYVDP